MAEDVCVLGWTCLVFFMAFLSVGDMSAEQQLELKLVTVPLSLDDNYYFQLVAPEDIGYTYKMRAARNFGVQLNTTYLNIDLIPVEPFDACTPVENSYMFRASAVALAERGGCSFLTKTLHAQDAGAVAVIIADYDKENIQNMVDMIQDETERAAGIPAFFLMGKDGYMIKKSLDENYLPSALINIPVNVTGLPLSRINLPPWTIW